MDDILSPVNLKSPDKFYKYKSITSDVEMERICNTVMKGEIYFSPARLLNDPFELHPTFSLDATQESQRADIIRMSKKFEPGLSDIERKVEVDRIMADSMAPKNIQTTTDSIQIIHTTYLTQNIGVFCLTTKPDNLLMWAHYADSHKGVCLQFDGYSRPFCNAQKVIYAAERLPINPYQDTKDDMLVKGLLTKSDHWRHEEEWRIWSKSEDLVTFRPSVVTGIIIGSLAPWSTVEWALKMARERKDSLQVYRAKVSGKKFELELRKISD